MKPEVDSLRESMKLINIYIYWSQKKDTIISIRKERGGIITDSVYIKKIVTSHQ